MKQTYGQLSQFLIKNIDKIQKLALKKHKEATVLLANNLELRDEIRGVIVFKKLGKSLARDSVNDGLNLEEAIEGIIFLKEAIWELLYKQNFMDKLTKDEIVHISQTMSVYCNVLASKIAIEYHAQVQKIIKESEERVRFMAESIPQKIFTADNRGNVDYFNPTWMEFTGLSFEQIRDWGWLQFIHPDDKEKNKKAWQHSVDTGEPFEIIHRFRRKDGVYRWHVSRARPMRDTKGKIFKWFGSNTDIHDQKRASEQKDEFIGIASHELKTPVTSIKAFTQVLQSRFAKAGDEKSTLLLGKMDAQLNKLTALIADLLDVTRIEGGKLQFHEDFFYFDELVSEIVEEIQRTTNRHAIRIDGACEKTVYGDRDRIGQVITNMLTNAVKYSPHSKKISVKTMADKKQITLSVQDFGVGIPKEKQGKIFERFYRVSGSTHDTVPGIGLGMYISSEIITRQKGKLWFTSEEGKGSTFCFSLPIQKRKIKQQKNTIVTEEMKHG